MLKRVQRQWPQLSKSEQKVARMVLDHAGEIPEMPLQVLAAKAAVSEPTVVRFCRALGCKGYQDFKLALARTQARQDRFFYRSIEYQEPTHSLLGKVFDGAVASLIDAKEALATEAMERAIGLLSQARRLEFYGSGGSGVVAQDAQHKFFRLGRPVVAYTDAHTYVSAAHLLDAQSVVVLISHRGRTASMIKAAESARQAGAPVIAITAAHSPLARVADVTITVDVTEESDSYAPIKSRIVQLVVLDCLALGVAARRDALLPQFERMQESLRQFDTQEK